MVANTIEMATTNGNAGEGEASSSNAIQGKARHGEASQRKAMQCRKRRCNERQTTARQGIDVRRLHCLLRSSGGVSNMCCHASEMF